MSYFRIGSLLLAIAAASLVPAQNQPDKKGKGGEKAPKGQQPPKEEEQNIHEIMKAQFGGVAGPTVGKLSTPGKGVIAEIKVPAGQTFVGQPGAGKFALETKNDGGERWAGVIILSDDGFIVFEFDPVGYIKDADKEKIDADGLMTSMKAGDEAMNKQRKAKGWPTISVDGWAEKPYYDPQTKNLTWAINLKGESGRTSINHEVRLLGREGVMRATLVCGPEDFAKAKQGVNPLLAGYTFTTGNTYAEWKPGDKVAAYGLAGLIAGGAVLGAAKMGWLAKFGKGIFVVIAAVIAGVWKVVTSIFGGGRRS